ncbi:phosphatase PAP2 family protein [Arcticibacterium luteifluviistationis]|uniref:Phosphatase PAP2 family protein n=1 Tax=Arcticibacterium luteifluviistationis TaxID=1784714 RepID=A0A2Z4G8X5_9BACT|nr:phosphatase PAP2 family protein [Arcticibacterium luteifluviistationis]AWV97616.1 phosphatase PAP2 family protein [Arcticibacterium luteifluviistationis]
METVVDGLIGLDERLFIFLNGIHHPNLDGFMAIITARNTWIPFYLLLIFYIGRRFPVKQAIIFVVYLIASVGLADFITSGLMKPFFERPRPCHNEALAGFVHLIGGHCGGKFGFASSHAANSFALFGGLFFIFRERKVFVKVLLLWAILVSYSRIYVGVHYPGDILVGALIGFLISFTLYTFLKKHFKTYQPNEKNNVTV